EGEDGGSPVAKITLVDHNKSASGRNLSWRFELPEHGAAGPGGAGQMDVAFEAFHPLGTRTVVGEAQGSFELVPGQAGGSAAELRVDAGFEFFVAHGDAQGLPSGGKGTELLVPLNVFQELRGMMKVRFVVPARFTMMVTSKPTTPRMVFTTCARGRPAVG